MNPFVIRRIAEAIGFAEGYFVTGSRPQRNNNPGDLETDITRKGIGQEGPYIVYATAEDGWEAVEKQVALMFGGSHNYNPSMTIAEMAEHYTATDQEAWAANVAKHLGVSVDTQLSTLMQTESLEKPTLQGH